MTMGIIRALAAASMNTFQNSTKSPFSSASIILAAWQSSQLPETIEGSMSSRGARGTMHDQSTDILFRRVRKSAAAPPAPAERRLWANSQIVIEGGSDSIVLQMMMDQLGF